MLRTDSITTLKGIGEKSAEHFYKAGIMTVEDLIRYYPRAYTHYEPPVTAAELKDHKKQAVHLRLTRQAAVVRRGRFIMTNSEGRDETGTVRLIWYNMPYLKNALPCGADKIFYGLVKENVLKSGRSTFTLEQPSMYSLEDYEALTRGYKPIYDLIKGLTNKMLSSAMEQVCSEGFVFPEYLPFSVRSDNNLCEYNYAVRQVHFPDDEESLRIARRRLIFDEFFLFILSVRLLKEHSVRLVNEFRCTKSTDAEGLIRSLPYTLTDDQINVWKEIQADLSSPNLMNRLVQGDVGSGKTIIAFLSMLQMTQNGFQAALMAPTEVLATQHYESMQEMLKKAGIHREVILLSGSMTAAQKRKAYEKISDGSASIIIGTHALIQDKVAFKDLGLVVTDEQHRFGVAQRDILSRKNASGKPAHILVMSATPIPRTLAIIIYGDLDISVIHQMPSNRKRIKNAVITSAMRSKAHKFVIDECQKGHQAYIICPMVEENEAIEAENVTDYTEKLKEILPPEIKAEMLHGKMKPAKKNEIMTRFAAGEIQVLVSTTVVEVGVNVPNATVMVVENAERFGLAQLHQLRGRVGRGDAQSYCVFIDGTEDGSAQKRLEILGKSNDGFFIANEDLRLRGPGDFFGLRQSGNPDFILGDIYADSDVMKQASDAVDRLLKEDPELEKNTALSSYFHRYYEKRITSPGL